MGGKRGAPKEEFGSIKVVTWYTTRGIPLGFLWSGMRIVIMLPSESAIRRIILVQAWDYRSQSGWEPNSVNHKFKLVNFPKRTQVWTQTCDLS